MHPTSKESKFGKDNFRILTESIETSSSFQDIFQESRSDALNWWTEDG